MLGNLRSKGQEDQLMKREGCDKWEDKKKEKGMEGEGREREERGMEREEGRKRKRGG